MIEFPAPSDTFRFAVDPAQATTFRIVAQGPGVPLFEDNISTQPDDPFEVTPDPVAFLAACVAKGYFVPRDPGGPPPLLQVDSAEFIEAKARQNWMVSATNLHPGMFKVLANMLVARGLTHLAFLAVPDAVLAPNGPLDLPFPPLPKDMRFAVDYKRPQMTGRDRSVEIVFQAPPDDAVLDGLYAMLADWGKLALLGGYPRKGQSPLASGLVPEVALMTEPLVLLQSIDVAFACDEAAFAPIISYLHSGAGKSAPVAHVKIR